MLQTHPYPILQKESCIDKYFLKETSKVNEKNKQQNYKDKLINRTDIMQVLGFYITAIVEIPV